MNVTVWIVVVVAVLFAGGCGTSTLPAYTPTPMDIYTHISHINPAGCVVNSNSAT